jgi:hypothetical protein
MCTNPRAHAPTKGGLVAEERERVVRKEQDEPDVEAHKVARAAEGAEPPEQEAGDRETDDPEVEGHSFRSH